MTNAAALEIIKEALRGTGAAFDNFHSDVKEFIADLNLAGLVIVPTEPTAEMLEAGETGIDSDCKLECSAERVYRAMIAKATGASS